MPLVHMIHFEYNLREKKQKQSTNVHCITVSNNNIIIDSIVDNDHNFFCSNRILNDAVYNFPNNQEEITLCVCPETFKVKNYVDDEPGKK